MILFGQVGWFFDWDLCLPVGGLLSLLALGLWAVLKVKRWREEELDEIDSLSPAQQIDHYQQMVDDGLLDPEEFARIKAQLETRAGLRTPPPANQPPDTSIQE